MIFAPTSEFTVYKLRDFLLYTLSGIGEDLFCHLCLDGGK